MEQKMIQLLYATTAAIGFVGDYRVARNWLSSNCGAQGK